MSKFGKWAAIVRDIILVVCAIVGSVAAVLALPASSQKWLIAKQPGFAWLLGRVQLPWLSLVVFMVLISWLSFRAGHRKLFRPRVPPPNKLPNGDAKIFNLLAAAGQSVGVVELALALQLPKYGAEVSLKRLESLELLEGYGDFYWLTPKGMEYAEKHDLFRVK